MGISNAFLKTLGCLFLTTTALLGPTFSAHAAVVDLTFEGIVPHDGSSAAINDFYNGGVASNGASGTNYGVSFSANAVTQCYNTSSVTCSNTSRGGVGDPASQDTGLAFLSGSAALLNFAAGFTTGFSFNYAAPFLASTVMVYSGLDGTGSLLATINLATTSDGRPDPACFNANYCPFTAVGVTFAGVAKSIAFGGTANFVEFDDVTFGSASPGVPSVPLPPALPMFGVALVALAGGSRMVRPRSAV